MSRFRTSRVFDIALVVTLLAALACARLHRTELGDWWYFRSYHPSSEVTSIARASGLNAAGTKLLFRGNPKFVDAEAIKSDCDVENLACITESGQIFILADPSKPDQTIVSAAHEMLHLAYRRLPQAERDTLAPLLDDAYSYLSTTDLHDELKDYTDIDDRRDEEHSIIGSEYGGLSPTLEQYYARYFAKRSLVVTSNTRSQ